MPTLIAKLSLKQSLAEARAVAEKWRGSPSLSAHLTDFQGMFSKTVVVEMEDGSEWVVQLRDNEIDTTKVALAHAKLGAVVPLTYRTAPSKAYFAFIAPFVPGTVWINKDKLSTDVMVSIATQIGRLLALCALGESSVAMIDSYVVPRLQQILSRELGDQPHEPFQHKIKQLMAQAADTKILPLALIHEDVNSMNIILNDSNDIAALIDWEAASLLPLGTNGWCIRMLSTVNRQRIDYETENTIPMARGFWRGFTANLPVALQGRKDVLNAIVTAMQIGMVMFLFWPGNDGLSNDQMDQGVARLNWFEDTFRPMANA
ncbi:hypothetical protein K474DRAFT_992134 [Panus rudis PR-1116 ss-1]|nr:hypothetical protein K474DRAFT_992134 [Panus rudis PR-1116 ss-1]